MLKSKPYTFVCAALLVTIVALVSPALAATGCPTAVSPTKAPLGVDSATYRPGKGLQLASRDSRFATTIRPRSMWLYVAQDAYDGRPEQVLMLRRARLQFGGHMWSEDVAYKLEFAFSARDLAFKNGVATKTPVLSWLIDFKHWRDLSVRVGQFKLGFNRQRLLSSGSQQMVDRSIGNGEFNIDRDIGFELFSKDLLGLGYLKYRLGVYMGEGRDAYQPSNFDMMGLARLEWLPFGIKVAGKTWKDYAEADLSRSPSPRLAMGAAYAYFKDARKDRGNRGNMPADGGTTNIGVAEFDLIYKQSGCSVMAEIYHRQGERFAGSELTELGDAIATTAPRNGFGWFAQGGCLLPGQPIEFAGRYSEVKPLGGASKSTLKAGYEAGAAVSWYIEGHAMKLQADFFRLWGKTGAGEADNRFRLQLQMAL